MSHTLVLDAGAMGTAFCFPLADAGNQVSLVETHLHGDWIPEIRSTGEHPKLKVQLPALIRAFTYDQLGRALDTSIDLVVLGVTPVGLTGNGACGTLTGGAMVLSQIYGRELDEIADPERKRAVAFRLGEALAKKFLDEYGTIICSQIQEKIMGRPFNLLDPEDKEAFEEMGGHTTPPALQWWVRARNGQQN